MEIKENKVVKMHYEGTLSNGEVFDSSKDREPLEFVYGLGMIIPGLEEALEGLKVGDKKKVEIPSEKAYGPVMAEAKQMVPKAQLPQDVELKEGMQLAAQGPQGVIPVTITKIAENEVEVDFNHPLAGKDLIFDIEIVDVRDATKEELEHGHVHSHEEEEEEEEISGGCCGGHCANHSNEKKMNGQCCQDKN